MEIKYDYVFFEKLSNNILDPNFICREGIFDLDWNLLEEQFVNSVKVKYKATDYELQPAMVETLMEDLFSPGSVYIINYVLNCKYKSFNDDVVEMPEEIEEDKKISEIVRKVILKFKGLSEKELESHMAEIVIKEISPGSGTLYNMAINGAFDGDIEMKNDIKNNAYNELLSVSDEERSQMAYKVHNGINHWLPFIVHAEIRQFMLSYIGTFQKIIDRLSYFLYKEEFYIDEYLISMFHYMNVDRFFAYTKRDGSLKDIGQTSAFSRENSSEIKYTFIDLCKNLERSSDLLMLNTTLNLDDVKKLGDELLIKVTNKLSTYSDNEQRVRYLSLLFEDIYTYKNCTYFWASTYESASDFQEIKEALANSIMYDYAEDINCQELACKINSVLPTLIFRISEVCFQYHTLGFDILAKKYLNQYVGLLVDYKFYSGDNQTMNAQQKATIEKQQSKTKKVYLTFDQLFNKPYVPYIDEFVEILRDVSPPLISDAGAWMRQAGAARVYFEALIKRDIIKRVPYAEGGFALENKFSVNSSGVTKKPDTKYAYESTASIIYREQFLHAIDIIKKDIETNII